MGAEQFDGRIIAPDQSLIEISSTVRAGDTDLVKMYLKSFKLGSGSFLNILKM